MSTQVAVSIINYNSKENIKRLFKDLYNQKNLELWLIDNDSPDKGGGEIKKQFPGINFIDAGKNVGFAKGHNLALKQIKSDYILLLNPDVEFEKDAINEMVQFMDSHPNCGIASGMLVNQDGSIQANGGDLPVGLPLLVWLFNLESIPNLEKNIGNFHRVDLEYYKKIRDVGWVGGTFMLIKRDTIEKIGFLPEDYFMYFEDTDFCYKAFQNKIKIMINPEVRVTHFGGGSSSNPTLAQFKGESIGLIIFYQKYFGEIIAFFVKLLLWISIFLRIIAFGLIGKPQTARNYWKILSYV